MGDRNTIVTIAVVVFAVLAAVFSGIGFYYYLEGDDLDKSLRIEKPVIELLRVAVSEQGSVPKEIKAVGAETARVDREEIGDAQSKQKDTRSLIDQAKADATKSHAAREDVDTKRTDAAKADAAKISAAYKTLADSLKSLDEVLKKNQDELRKEQENLLDAKSVDIDKMTKLAAEVSAARDKLATMEGKLKRMKERKERLDQLNEDGQVISADQNTNLAMVNLGARQGVRPGMLFDVFELKKDGKKVRKAKLRLQKVESQQSTAVILAARPVPRSCPLCGWSTTDTTMLFCTYCRGGEPPELKDVVRLVEGTSNMAVVAPDFLNPVAKGDWISSPFYLGGKNRKAFAFAIAGQPVGHSRQEIYTFLKENGCTLAEDITIDTDFAIVGTGPNVDEDLKKARGLGVSILREQDLFNFFGRIGTSSEVPADEATNPSPRPSVELSEVLRGQELKRQEAYDYKR